MSITTSPQRNSVDDPTGTAPAAAVLRLVEAAGADEHVRHRSRNAFRGAEHDLQGQALALESNCLRRRAERYAEAVECGAALTAEEVDSVLRAFRAYRPLLFDADRAKNDAAHRRLARALGVRRSRRRDATATPDASVA